MHKPNRLFEDKFDRLRVVREITQLSVLKGEQGYTRLLAIVENDFLFKVGANITINRVEFITPATVTAEYLETVDLGTTWFLYGVEHNQNGVPAVRALLRAGAKYSPVGGANVGGYEYEDELARKVVEWEYVRQTVECFDKYDAGGGQDFINLCQFLQSTRHIEGDVIEIGAYRGSSGCVMLNYAMRIGIEDKEFFFLDTFTGFDYPEAHDSADTIWAGTHRTEGFETIKERLQSRFGRPIHVIESNIISDDLPSNLGTICLANIDVDLYEAVRAALFKVAPRIAAGGIMLCEDAGHTPNLIGARVALDDFLETASGKQFTPIFLTSGQVALVRHTV